MAGARTGAQLRSVIEDAAPASADSMQFRPAVLDAMSTYVGHDGACLATTDLASLVPTQLLTVGYDDPRALPAAIAFEYGGRPQPSSFDAMARRGTPIRTIREVTPGP